MTFFSSRRSLALRLLCTLVLAALLLGGLAGGAFGAAAAQFSANVRANQDTSDQQQEPTLAIDPANPNAVLVAAKDWRTGTKQVWDYRSSDGGLTWSDS